MLAPDLAALASALGLSCPSDSAEWEERLRTRRKQEVYADFLEARVTCGARGPALPADFYQLVGSDPDLNAVMLEGRLGYDDAVLPCVADAVGRVPHGTIVEIASYGGLAALYLRVKSATPDGRQVHVHLGVAGRFAYAYSCSTHDFREMKVADAGLARPLFGSVVESLTRLQQSGEAAAIDPKPEALPAMLRALLGG